jgi:hypothetical protein
MKALIPSRSRLLIILLALSGCMLLSCNTEVKPDRSTGRTNEILIVTNSKADWESGVIGRTIRDFFEQPLNGLPQPEPMFWLFNVAEKDFNKTFRAQHNILIIDIDRNFDKSLVETRSDYWSVPQRVIKITAPDTLAFLQAFQEHKTAFLKAFNELEIRRTNEQFKMARSVSLVNRIARKFGFSIQIPGGFVVAAESDQFMWLRQSMHKVKQDVELGILIHTEPYTDTSAFSGSNILIRRDSLTAIHIEGPSPGSFMAVSTGIIDPLFTRKDDFAAGFAVETRGLWMVRNDFMGGPFISFTFLDPQSERLITLDGYVYNPGDLKRNFIRQMEAIFYTIAFEAKE